MSKGDVVIKTNGGSSEVTFRSNNIAGGLAVTPELNWMNKPIKGQWNITHLNSGFAILWEAVTYRQAVHILETMLTVFDWTSFRNAAELDNETIAMLKRERQKATDEVQS